MEENIDTFESRIIKHVYLPNQMWSRQSPEKIIFHYLFFSSSHIPSRHEREVNEFRKLEREKSFDEARTAVQSQIEKIFMKTGAGGSNSNNAKGMPMLPSHTTTNRVSRRDLEARHSTINNNNSRRRMPSLEKKVGIIHISNCSKIIPKPRRRPQQRTARVIYHS